MMFCVDNDVCFTNVELSIRIVIFFVISVVLSSDTYAHPVYAHYCLTPFWQFILYDRTRENNRVLLLWSWDTTLGPSPGFYKPSEPVISNLVENLA